MSGQASFGWVLLVLGLVIAGVGLVSIFAPSIPWLGRRPGDTRIERENFRMYFPLMTCLLLSVALTLVAWLVRWLRGYEEVKRWQPTSSVAIMSSGTRKQAGSEERSRKR
jgi:hypothetical protein